MLRFLFRRTFLLVASLAASILLPFVWMNKDWKQVATEKYRSWSQQPGDEAPSNWSSPTSYTANASVRHTGYSTAPVTNPEQDTDLASRSPPGAALTPAIEVHEALRFDVTPEWVVRRWPRVTNVATENGWTGLRVPLVTGTRSEDVAGALTYYFDTRGQVQRLALQGTTGDAATLIGVVTRHYGLRNEGGPGTGLYIARWNGRPTSVLHTRQTAVIRADMPQTRWEVLMEINRPNFAYGLSPAIQQQLANRL